MKKEEQFKQGILTHLMELELYDDNGGPNGYRCAFCELGVLAGGLRQARKIAEQTYGRCPVMKKQSN